MSRFNGATRKVKHGHRRRLLVGMEALEDRRLLAADIAPVSYSFFQDANTAPERIPGEIVIGFRAGTSGDEMRGLAQAHGISSLKSLYMGGDARPVRSATIPDQAVDAVLRAIQNHPLVEYAEPNFTASALLTPNDSYYGYQWHLQNAGTGSIDVAAAWDVTNGSGITVAVVDTGVAYENRSDGTGSYYLAPDLADTRFVPGYDFINNDPHANDDHSHGTHVAGTIAQSTNNSLGTAGVAYGTSIMPIKALGRDGSGSHSAIAQGVRWAADQGAQIINLSLGSSSGSTTLRDALAYAYGKGATIIAAAGNDGTNSVSYPAAYDAYVIAVSATRYDESLAGYSNYGSSIDLAAPGGDLSVDQNNDGYADGVLQNTFNPSTKNTGEFGYYFFQGTSMATPHVAGVAGLVASVLVGQGDSADPDTIRSILQTTARDKGPSGLDMYHGHGIVDATAAVQAALSPSNSAPTALADSATTNKDEPVVIDVLANDYDPDGDSLSVISVTTPANGNVIVQSDNRVTYTPRAGFVGSDSFSYTISDPDGATSTAVVTVTVSDTASEPIVRVADLDGGVNTNKNRWRAQVSTLIVDGTNQPVAGATVSGSWSDGRSATAVTDASGRYTFGSAWQANRTASITFTVTSVTATGLTYTPTANSDPDGDSDGTRITVRKDGTTSGAKSSGEEQWTLLAPAVGSFTVVTLADSPVIVEAKPDLSRAGLPLRMPQQTPTVVHQPASATRPTASAVPSAPSISSHATLAEWDTSLVDILEETI